MQSARCRLCDLSNRLSKCTPAVWSPMASPELQGQIVPAVGLGHELESMRTIGALQANSMGKDGQRIGHYAVPLDKWIRSLGIEKTHSSRPPKERSARAAICRRKNLPHGLAITGRTSATGAPRPSLRTLFNLSATLQVNRPVLILRVERSVSIPDSRRRLADPATAGLPLG